MPTESVIDGMTALSLVEERLKSSLDFPYFNGVFAQLRYCFGFSWNTQLPYSAHNAALPDYPPLDVTEVEVGAHRGLFVNQFIALTKTMYSDPKPVFSEIDDVLSDLRSNLFQKLYKRGSWAEALASAFLDGHATGTGFVRIGIVPGDSGLGEVDVRYVSPLEVLWDPFEADFRKARWAAWQIDLPVDEAVAMYPDYAKQIEAGATDKFQGTQTRVRRVRILEYWDKKCCYHFFGGNVDMSRCIYRGKNPYGVIPLASMMYLIVPRAKRPIGTVLLQMSSSAELRNLYKYLSQTAYQQPLDIVDYSQLDKGDMEEVSKGNRTTVGRKSGDLNGTPAVERIPAKELSGTAFQWFNKVERDFDMTGNANQYEQNSLPGGSRTKFEVQFYQDKTSWMGGWAQKQALLFIADVVEKVMAVAKVGHRRPEMLSYEGHRWQLNNPQDPNSSIEYLLDEPSDVLIDAASVRYSDAMIEMQNQLGKLSVLKEGVAAGVYNPHTYFAKLLSIAGEDDEDAWMQPQQVAQGMMPGAQDLAGTPQPPVQTPVPA